MIDALFLNLLRTSLAVGAVILILLAVSPLWNRRFAALWKKRLWYLLAAVLLAGSAAAVPAGIARITIAIPARQVEIVRTEAGGAQIGITSQNQSAGTGDGTGADIAAPAAQESGGADAPQTKTARALDLLTAAELLWAAGALAWTLRMAMGESLFRRQLRRWARPVQSEALLSIYRELCAETGKGACPALLVCPGVGGPLLTGLLRPRLLLPTEDCAEPETRYILRHAHFLRDEIPLVGTLPVAFI